VSNVYSAAKTIVKKTAVVLQAHAMFATGMLLLQKR
jgi:hypothetical protein